MIHVIFRLCQLKCSYVAALYVPPLPNLLFFFLFTAVCVYRIVGWWVVSYNLERMCQEAVMAWSRYFPGICLEGLRKTTKSHCCGLESNRSSFDYKSRAFPSHQPDRCYLPIVHTILYRPLTFSVIVSCSATNMLETVLYWPVFLWVTC